MITLGDRERVKYDDHIDKSLSVCYNKGTNLQSCARLDHGLAYYYDCIVVWRLMEFLWRTDAPLLQLPLFRNYPCKLSNQSEDVVITVPNYFSENWLRPATWLKWKVRKKKKALSTDKNSLMPRKGSTAHVYSLNRGKKGLRILSNQDETVERDEWVMCSLGNTTMYGRRLMVD